jgi:hypothetical protein
MRDSSTTLLFEQEIKSLLSQYGPMKTTQMYPLIKANLPDRCDDADLNDGNGEIAWKHRVRAAQERLSKKKQIVRSDGDQRWYLTPKSE